MRNTIDINMETAEPTWNSRETENTVKWDVEKAKEAEQNEKENTKQRCTTFITELSISSYCTHYKRNKRKNRLTAYNNDDLRDRRIGKKRVEKKLGRNVYFYFGYNFYWQTG